MRLPVLVTGGSGFIGGTLVSELLARDHRVTIFDDLSGAAPDWQEPFRALLSEAGDPSDRLRFVQGDVRDPAAVDGAMKGHRIVVHLAAHTDIRAGLGDPRRDLEIGVIGTWNVLDAMRRLGVSTLLYASSGTIYGYPVVVPTPEDHGPLRPESHYAAAKLAGEALISGFAALHGWRALVFRFGNTVGARSDHGVVHDLVVKLLRDSTSLELLGDGRQAKPYIAVEDVVAGMLHALAEAPQTPVSTYNLGTFGTLTVDRVADLVIDALGLEGRSVERRFLGASPTGGGGWPGDTPLVDFDTSQLRSIGWRPRWSAEEAVLRAARGTAERMKNGSRRLLTADERRAAVRLTAEAEGPSRLAVPGAP